MSVEQLNTWVTIGVLGIYFYLAFVFWHAKKEDKSKGGD
jgi:hypothetical protein